MPDIDGLKSLRHLHASEFIGSGSGILLSGERPRIIHTENKPRTRRPPQILSSFEPFKA